MGVHEVLSHTHERTPTWSSNFSSANQLSSERGTENTDFIDFFQAIYIWLGAYNVFHLEFGSPPPLSHLMKLIVFENLCVCDDESVFKYEHSMQLCSM